MKKKRQIKKYIIYSLIILGVIGAFIGVLLFLNYNKNSYTLLEKRWINDSKTSSIKINVDSNIPAFTYDGEGIVYEFIDDLEEDTGLSFDIVTGGGGDYEFKASNERNEENILFYTDVYSIVTNKSVAVNSIKDLEDKTIGVLKEDLSYISYYFTDVSSLDFKTYDNFNALSSALEKDIDVMLIPSNEHLNDILNKKYDILYKVDGLNRYYELNTEAGNKNLNSIMKKFMNKWKKKLNSKYNENKLKLYMNNKNITQMDVEKITKKDLVVGYVKNLPYEGSIQKHFTGITNEYLEGFSSFSGVTYKYIKYKNVNSLSNALIKQKVDIIMNYANLDNTNYNSSSYVTASNYVVLAHNSNDIVVDNIYSLKNNTVYMLADNNLTKSLKKEDIFKIKEQENVKKLFKKIDENSIIVIDKIVYDTYKDGKLKNYSIRLMEDNSYGYNFLTTKNYKHLSEMFDFYLKTTSSKQIVNNATYNTIETIRNKSIFGFVATNIMYILLFALVLVYIFDKYRNRIKLQKKIKKEEKIMYIDSMTSLKNRNYLTDNMDLWNSNKVYPQTIIVIDLKNVKAINDENGTSEGDRQIKAAANILIRSQRENSEIMRTDGNEFMIYLVGYSEKAILSYLHKLNKEFANLPYEYGARFGYSIIESEIKTIDDAINESIIMMKRD